MLKGFTKYESARILGARALQISMNAPLLIKIEKEDLERVNYDALKIAEIELNSEILPIAIKRPFPEKKEERLKRTQKVTASNESLAEEDASEEGGEIMELATPEDEMEEDTSDSESE
jgi:DNA-directed RNA polymerase subunit K/omega